MYDEQLVMEEFLRSFPAKKKKKNLNLPLFLGVVFSILSQWRSTLYGLTLYRIIGTTTKYLYVFRNPVTRRTTRNQNENPVLFSTLRWACTAFVSFFFSSARARLLCVRPLLSTIRARIP